MNPFIFYFKICMCLNINLPDSFPYYQWNKLIRACEDKALSILCIKIVIMGFIINEINKVFVTAS